MDWKTLSGRLRALLSAGDSTDVADADPTRRTLLLGLGLAGGALVLGTGFGPTPAAAVVQESAPDDGAIRLAQDRTYRDRYDRRYDWRDRYDDRRERRRERYRRRDLIRRCEDSPRFRRDNRNLCRRLIGGYSPRRGSCVDLGGFRICSD